jgi:hypothetical protein
MADCGAGPQASDLGFDYVIMLSVVVVLWQPQSCGCDDFVVEMDPYADYALCATLYAICWGLVLE